MWKSSIEYISLYALSVYEQRSVLAKQTCFFQRETVVLLHQVKKKLNTWKFFVYFIIIANSHRKCHTRYEVMKCFTRLQCIDSQVSRWTNSNDSAGVCKSSISFLFCTTTYHFSLYRVRIISTGKTNSRPVQQIDQPKIVCQSSAQIGWTLNYLVCTKVNILFYDIQEPGGKNRRKLSQWTYLWHT